MNGRVYDAEIGRFLSADIVIQDVTNLQSLNAYSYVLNNPLSFTDPSGFFFKSLFRAIGNFFKSVFRAIGNVFKAVLRSSIGRAIIQVAACTFGGVIGCVAITAALTLATGGSITEALTAAAFAFASAGVWSAVHVVLVGASAVVKVAVHGVVNGALSVAQGGSFLQGFAAGAIGQAGGLVSENVLGPAGTGGPEAIAGRTAIAAAAGGFGAELTGGKFSNGAVSAAFAHLFNDEGTYRQRGYEPTSYGGGDIVCNDGNSGCQYVGINDPTYPTLDILAALSGVGVVVKGGLRLLGFVGTGGALRNANLASLSLTELKAIIGRGGGNEQLSVFFSTGEVGPLVTGQRLLAYREIAIRTIANPTKGNMAAVRLQTDRIRTIDEYLKTLRN